MLLWTNHVTEAHYPLMDKIKEIGYQGIEIPIGDGDVSHYEKIGEHIKGLGLEVTAVTSLMEDQNIASPDSKVRAVGLERLNWVVDVCQAMGSKLVCGPFHSAFAYFTRVPPTEDEKKWSIENMQKAGDYAQKAGVLLCPEVLNRFECYLLNTMVDMKDYLDRVNHPSVATIYDTHHGNIEEKSHEDAFKTIGKYLKHVHISENDRGAPGRGMTDWDRVFKGLKEVNYDGWLMIEAFSTTIPEFANAINVWRNYSPAMEVCEEGFELINRKWNQF